MTTFTTTRCEAIFNQVNEQLTKMNRRPLIIDESGVIRLPQNGKAIANVDNASFGLTPYLAKLQSIEFFNSLEDGLIEHIENYVRSQFAEWFKPNPRDVTKFARFICGEYEVTTKDSFDELYEAGIVNEHMNDWWLD